MEPELRITPSGGQVMSFDVFRSLDPAKLYRQLEAAGRKKYRPTRIIRTFRDEIGRGMWDTVEVIHTSRGTFYNVKQMTEFTL